MVYGMMTHDIYSILNIDRTDNFAEVEQLYLYKVQSFSAAIANNFSTVDRVYLEDLKAAWKKVNNQEKLNYYFINNHFLLDFPKPEEISLGEEIKLVYIPVVLEERTTSENLDDTVLRLERLTEAANFQEIFDYEYLAQLLTNKSKQSPLLVGITVAEAERIHELHGQSQFAVITEVSVLPHQLSRERYSERDIYCGEEGKIAPYFCLAKENIFQAQDIISVSPIELYEHSQNQNSIDPRWLWPKIGRKYIVISNLQSDFPLQIPFFNPQDLLSLTDLNQNMQIKELKQAVEALRDYGQELASECQEIQSQIQEMNNYHLEYPGKENFKKEADILNNEEFSMGRLFQELDEELQLFIRNINSVKLTLPTFSGALVYFKEDLNKRLDKYSELLAEYRGQEKALIANVLIALTGIGLLALLPKLAYSYYTKGKAEGFFTQTTAKEKLDHVRQTINDLSLNDFILPKRLLS
jgi:hypothetical protein